MNTSVPRNDPRAKTMLLAFVILPLCAQLGLAVWRFGHEQRGVRASALVAMADSAAERLRAGMPTGGSVPTGATVAAVVEAYRGRGARLTWSRVERQDGPVDGVPGAVVARLVSLDRSFPAGIGGRLAGVAPTRDADQWDVTGMVVVMFEAADPPRFPRAAALAAVLVVIGVGAMGWFWLRRPARWLASTMVAVPLAFAVILANVRVAGSVAGDHGLWAVMGAGGWTIVAATGLSLAGLAGRPLALREALRAWAFLAPSLGHLLVFSVGPILFAFWLSFHEWNLIEPARPFVGLANYRELAADGEFWNAVRNTAVYVLFVPAGMVVGLALALLANRRIPGVRLMRTVFFLPYITSFVAISLVWRWMFQPDVGLFNNLLSRVGVGPLPWLSSPATALPSLMLMSVWMYAGYMMVIFLAGLQNIPESLYESARIDGAGPWRRFIHITLPMLRPTLLFILVTMVIFMFQVFTAVYVMTEGGPLHATDVIVYHVYRAAWEYLRMGYASAMAWVLFAVVFLVTLIQFRFLGDRGRLPG